MIDELIEGVADAAAELGVEIADALLTNVGKNKLAKTDTPCRGSGGACASCRYQALGEGKDHCYMFARAPKALTCGQYTPQPHR